jgi:hypothetical protein
MISGRALLTCLALGLTAALCAPSGAEAATRHRVVHHPRHIAAVAHRRPVHHPARLARSGGGDTVRIIRAHPHGSADTAPAGAMPG